MTAANRVSTVYTEVITSGQSPANRVSTAYTEVITSGQNPKNRVSATYIEVIAAPPTLIAAIPFRTHKRR